MIRFFVSKKDVQDDIVKLGSEELDHIRSLRIKPDEAFVVCDGECNDYVCKLLDRSDKQYAKLRDGAAYAKVIAKKQVDTEPTVKVSVYIAFSKGDRMDYAVQKSVEIGAHEIFLFSSELCVAIPKNIDKKVDRLQRISLSAAKLSNRGIVPKVSSIGDFKAAIASASESSDTTLFFYEYEDQTNIKQALEGGCCPEKSGGFGSFSIITGPEGGFTGAEVDYVSAMGIPVLSLGPRILRNETAPIVALTAVMYHTDNL